MPAPGEVVYKQFTLRHPISRIAADADSDPVAVFICNGQDTVVSCEILHIQLGVYRVSARIPNSCITGDEIQFRITATVGASTEEDGQTQSKIFDIGEVEARSVSASAVNTYTSSYDTSYDIGDVVYLKESAALGFLEAVRISGIYKRDNGWVYTVSARSSNPSAADHYGDHASVVLGSVMYFTIDEFIPLCDALDLIEANLQRQLSNVQSQRSSLCG